MENTNSAANLVKLISELPQAITSLPVFYDDCDCGRGPHAIAGLFPDKDLSGKIYLRPSSVECKSSDVIAAYEQLKQENDDITKRVKEAVESGVESTAHTTSPAGWNRCALKIKVGKVGALFNPKDSQECADCITDYFKDAIRDSIPLSSDNRRWRFFKVGYPGSILELPFELTNVQVKMTVIGMSVPDEDTSHERYMHLDLQFKVIIDWTPYLSYWGWKRTDIRYNHRDVYEFVDTLSLTLLPLGTEGEASS